MSLAVDAAIRCPIGRDRAALRSLAARSDRRGLLQLTGHMGALATTGLLMAQTWGSLWLAPAMLLHGILMAFLFAPCMRRSTAPRFAAAG